MIQIDVHIYSESGSEVQAQISEVLKKLDHFNRNVESLMSASDALKTAIARLQASDTRMLMALQETRDQNKSIAASLADVSAKLAAMPADTAELEAAVNQAVTDLNTTADTVDAAVKANPDVPNLPPAPASNPGPQATDSPAAI